MSEPFSHAGDVVRLMDHLGLDRLAVVGSSGGGAVALQVASTVPERVDALVLLCAAADGVDPTDDLLAFARRESELLNDGDVTGATNLNADMWLQPDVDNATRELFREMQANAFRVQLAARRRRPRAGRRHRPRPDQLPYDRRHGRARPAVVRRRRRPPRGRAATSRPHRPPVGRSPAQPPAPG